MSDIITELRERSLRAEQEGEPIALLDEAADEIVRLRKKETELLAAGDLLESQLFSVAKQRDAVRLTDAEREAIERLCEATHELIADDKRADGCHWKDDLAAVAVARGLLERLK